MSQGKRLPYKEASPIIAELSALLSPNTQDYLICGSYRRNKPTIGDVDLVALPTNPDAYREQMDKHVFNGIYDKGINAGGNQTWGATKRSLVYKDVNFDVIIADEAQFGFKVWLSTGPSDGNTAMMSLLKNRYSAVRPAEGYLWHVSYTKTHPKYEPARGFARLGKLHCPDESTFFHLIGLPSCAPEWRNEAYYRKHLGKSPAPVGGEFKKYYAIEEKQLTQQKMF